MQELSDMIAISESTPGPIGVNMATFAGFKTAGIPGGVLATLSLVVPSIIIIVIIAKFLDGFQENKVVKAVFWGIRPAVTALIAVAVLNLIKVSLFVETAGKMVLRYKSAILCVIVFALLQWKKLKKMHPAMWVLIAAVVGIVLKM